jgi:hypothetical protein
MSSQQNDEPEYKYMRRTPPKARGFLSSAYYKYELSTALYMLDPWEKRLFSM